LSKKGVDVAHVKIVLLGAGSVIFSLRVLQDLIFHREALSGSTLVLVDIDERKLERVALLARQINRQAAAGYVVQHTPDRTKALVGADYVIISVEIDRDRLWQLDWQIPLKHGIRHTLGENAGPGGLAHTLRTVPLVMEICRDVERLCPNAWVLNLTNPLSRVCLAIARHTALKFVGLCHQIGEGYYIAAHLLGRVGRAGPWPDNLRQQEEAKRWLDIKAAGINHFTWMLDIRDKATGRDLYPELREAARRAAQDFHPLSRHLLDVFGLMPTGGDEHVGELIGYAGEVAELHGPDFALLARRRREFEHLLEAAADEQADLTEWLTGHSMERAVDIIAALHGNSNTFEQSANIVNRGCIANLPDEAIVEVPVMVGGAGIHGLNVGPLPTGIAAMCAQQIAIQELAVEAALSGSRRLALQALLLDPTLNSRATAEAVLADLLAAHAGHLPLFAG
jgi:alpha-galactosidase